MSKRILIDGVHQEEVRVVVTEGARLQDFEFETAAKKQIKGNIYLAKVTRVEPSLQAAFVEYGGNKQGFLPFSEIHPDYYSIPVADKKDSDGDVETANDNDLSAEAGRSESSSDESGESEQQSDIDTLGEESEVEAKRSNLYRRYKIQEVVKRGQVMLVQVIKEERGNKGASLTTYMSLPGRYSVFMPNSERQGGVSRRIGDVEDRRKLKAMIDELSLEDGASIIIRTAGASASREEIQRDFEYLNGIWESIKKMTVSSTAPTLIYEEGNIIKRTIRDLYDNSISEIVVEGDEAFEQAKQVLQLLAPDQENKLKKHTENVPIFWHYEVEDELAKLYDNKAYLKSGGYIVINSTEALVAIDVNSGKSTRERNVEETATKTNLEAAYEIARQLRLRDLAGLIVIDFIDMMESRNRRAVERALKDALQADRAKIQVGRISPFGLLEMSRQRLHSSLVESNMVACQTCQGTGIVRSPESTAIAVIRAIDNEAEKDGVLKVIVNAPMEVAFYLLNKKRSDIALIEERYDISVAVEGNESLSGQDYFIKSERDSQKEGERKPRKRRHRYHHHDNNAESFEDNAEPRRQERHEREEHPRDRDEQPNVYALDNERERGGEHRRGRRRRGRGRFDDRKRRNFRHRGDRDNNRNFGEHRNDRNNHERRDFHKVPEAAVADQAVKKHSESVLRSLWRKIVE